MGLFEQLSWERPGLIQLFWVAAALLVILLWLQSTVRDSLSSFISQHMQKRISTRRTLRRRFLRLALIGTTLFSGILALRGPVTLGELESVTTKQPQADIMVALDVSKSMLAEDAAPNRLERAKAEVLDMLTSLGGHRVGLVAFAGGARILTPLTTDHDSFRIELRDAGPNSVSRGGTQLGDAINKSLSGFRSQPGSKIILLITDGEDHDSYPMDAAKAALERGVRIVTIGFGSEQGSEIIITDTKTGARNALTDRQGQVVRSRLDGETLRNIALTTEGAYIPAGVAALDLESILAEHLRPMILDATRTQKRQLPTQQYTWFVLICFISLLGATWLDATGATTEEMS